MEKTIRIDGKEVRLRATAALPIRYKAQFGRDLFADIYKMEPAIKKEDYSKLDTLIFYDLVWLMAKSANPNIPNLEEWLDQFDAFPVEDVFSVCLEMLSALMASKKKPHPAQRRNR
ncbi:MAG: hypothetical protein C0P72_012140 [Clostridia bacterium]